MTFPGKFLAYYYKQLFLSQNQNISTTHSSESRLRLFTKTLQNFLFLFKNDQNQSIHKIIATERTFLSNENSRTPMPQQLVELKIEKTRLFWTGLWPIGISPSQLAYMSASALGANDTRFSCLPLLFESIWLLGIGSNRSVNFSQIKFKLKCSFPNQAAVRIRCACLKD